MSHDFLSYGISDFGLVHHGTASVSTAVWSMLHIQLIHKREESVLIIVTYYRLLTCGKLTTYLAEIDEQAQDMFDTIVNQTKEVQGITEELNAENPMEWVR